jgi:hypothetical protein
VSGGDVFLRSIATVTEPAQLVGQRGAITLPALEDGRRALHLLPTETRSHIAAHGKQSIIRLGDAGAPLLRRFWRGQLARVLGALRADDGGIETRAVEKLDWDDELERLGKVARKLHIAAGEASMASVASQIGVDVSFDLANQNVRRVLDFLANRPNGITEVNQTTKDDVARVVGEALDEGVGIDDLGKRLSTLFEENYRGRAVTVTRTESMHAYNSASVLGYQESGVVSMCEIYDNPEHAEPYDGADDGLTCASRHGIIVDLDRAMFHLGSDHPNGSATAIPILSKPLGEE